MDRIRFRGLRFLQVNLGTHPFVPSRKGIAPWAAAICAIATLFGSATARAQTNSWISTAAGKWEDGTKWSLGLAPTNTQSVFVTNVTTKTVTIDVTTAGTTSMTVSNLTVGAPVGSINTLFLNNAGLGTPLRVRNTFTISDGGVLDIDNSVLNVDRSGIFYVRGNAYLKSGAIVTTNSSALTGCSSIGVGQVTISNGTWLAQNITVGLCLSGPGALTLAGGTNWLSSQMAIGFDPGATGMVWITGGTLIVTNQPIIVGLQGSGRLTLSNGIVNAGTILFAPIPGSVGTLTVAGGTFAANRLIATNSAATIEFSGGTSTVVNADVAASGLTIIGNNGRTAVLNLPGGTNRFDNGFSVAWNSASTGTVWLTSGELQMTNDLFGTRIGDSGVGQMAISNATCRVDKIIVAFNNGSSGTLTLANGSSLVTSLLDLGLDFNATGTVWLTGGQLIVTNGPTVLGDHGHARMTVSNGTWRAREVRVGSSIGSHGTLTIVGGTNQIATSLQAGVLADATGTVWLTGGMLVVTNAPTIIANNGVGQLTISNASMRTSTLDVGHGFGSAGTLELSGGSLITDKLVMTNLNSRLVFNSGTLETKFTVATNLYGSTS